MLKSGNCRYVFFAIVIRVYCISAVVIGELIVFCLRCTNNIYFAAFEAGYVMIAYAQLN